MVTFDGWFAVHTQSRQEASVERGLRERKFETFFPHMSVWEPKDKRRLDLVKKPYMPRYLFVQLDPKEPAFYKVNETPGVATVVYAPGGIPFPIPESVMRSLMLKTNPSGLVYSTPRAKPRFEGRRGDWVRLSETSAYFGFLAEISRVDGGDKIIIELETLGRMVPVQIKPEDVSELISVNVESERSKLGSHRA